MINNVLSKLLLPLIVLPLFWQGNLSAAPKLVPDSPIASFHPVAAPGFSIAESAFGSAAIYEDGTGSLQVSIVTVGSTTWTTLPSRPDSVYPPGFVFDDT